MSKRKEVEDWLKNNPEQLEWAKEYLQKKNIPLSVDRGYEQVVESMKQLDKETLRLMRLAWNRFGSNAKRHRKTRSFTLSDEAMRSLKRTASKRPQSQVLEELILSIDKLKDETRQKIEKQHTLAALKQRHDIDSLKEVLQEWTQKTEGLLLEWSRQHVLLVANRLDAKTGLSEAQLLQALPPYEQAKQDFLKIIASRPAIAKLFKKEQDKAAMRPPPPAALAIKQPDPDDALPSSDS